MKMTFYVLMMIVEPPHVRCEIDKPMPDFSLSLSTVCETLDRTSDAILFADGLVKNLFFSTAKLR